MIIINNYENANVCNIRARTDIIYGLVRRARILQNNCCASRVFLEYPVNTTRYIDYLFRRACRLSSSGPTRRLNTLRNVLLFLLSYVEVYASFNGVDVMKTDRQAVVNPVARASFTGLANESESLLHDAAGLLTRNTRKDLRPT